MSAASTASSNCWLPPRNVVWTCASSPRDPAKWNSCSWKISVMLRKMAVDAFRRPSWFQRAAERAAHFFTRSL
jgi:hypothetical protein